MPGLRKRPPKTDKIALVPRHVEGEGMRKRELWEEKSEEGA